MPSAFALQVYGVTGRQQDGATLQQEIIKNFCSGKAGPLSVSQRSLRESLPYPCNPWLPFSLQPLTFSL